MSIRIGKGSDAFSVNTLPESNVLCIGGRDISMEDFRYIVNYVMCNSELKEQDHRIELIKDINNLVITEINGQKRLIGERPVSKYFSGW